MYKHCLLIIFLGAFLPGFGSQADDTIKKSTLTFSGFIHADAMYDTRQVVEAREGYLLLYPKKIQNDVQGDDINDAGSFNQYAMTARLTARMTGPDAFGAKTSAVLEGDFTGASNVENNSLRLRHAYARLQWKKTVLLAGQYWHPFDVPEMIPGVLSLNTGAPFHSFSRQPQIRIDYRQKNVNFVLVASSQRDYVNPGPAGATSVYLRNAIIPNMHAQIQYYGKSIFMGAGIDFKRLVPRLVTDSNYSASESVDSWAVIGFLKKDFGKLCLKIQSSYGQNLNDHLMMGGYGVSRRDPINDKRNYSSLNYWNNWLCLNNKGKNIQYSVFAGYTKALGSRDMIIGPVYARDPDIDYLFRLSPMITWFSGKMSFAFEAEYTVASYGIPDEKFRIHSGKPVQNLRSSISAVYNF